MVDVSIIVPVYNARNYLDNCIKSIINQSVEPREIIIVDDGSTDGSSDLCDDYANRFDRIIVLHKKNGGICDARNKGIEIATGEWITFCDSDDVVEPDWLEILYESAKEKPEYSVICEYDKVDEKKGIRKRIAIPGISKPSVIEKEDYYLLYREGYCPYVWIRIYNRELLIRNNIRFNYDYKMGAEDVIFNIDYASHCKGYYYIPKHVYDWIDHNGYSLSRTFNPHLFSLREKLFFVRKPLIAEKYKRDYYNTTFFTYLKRSRVMLQMEKSR